MIVYACPKCSYVYKSPVRLAGCTHDCKTSRNPHQPMKEMPNDAQPA